MGQTMVKLKAISGLIKPELPIVAGTCVIFGEILALGKLPSPLQAMLGFSVGLCLSGAAMISNDYFDVEVDKINHPDRPLPAGKVTVKEVIALTFLFSLLGLASALTFGSFAFSIATITWFLGIAYNWRIKETGLLGNVFVSLSVAMTFIFGGLAVGRGLVGLVLTFGMLAFIFDLAEEIAGGALDIEGDHARHVKSIAISKGKGFALSLAGILFCLFILLTSLPWFLGWLGLTYLLMILPTDCVIAYLALRLKNSPNVKEGQKTKRLLYLCLTVFVIAFMASSFL